tara:strand:+ start:260 stop:619 length:360 start_codon:yes stop_codon:yes gene_type:complete
MSAYGSFRADGLPNSASYATKHDTNISTATELISGGEHNNIIITDLIVSKNSDGDMSFFDGPTKIMTLYIKSSDNGESIESLNFTAGLKITSNSGLYVQLDSTNTDYSVLANYYRSETR